MNKITYIKDNANCLNTHSKQSGFSLIEVMVAALILSIGILGVIGLQIVGLKGTTQSYMKQQAMSVVHSLTERMRSNAPGVAAGNYTLTSAESDSFDCSVQPMCTTVTENCTSATIANLDLHNAICGYQATGAQTTGGVKVTGTNDISTFLDGQLEISCPGTSCTTGDVRITLKWEERAFGEEDVDTDSLVISTRILP